MTLAPHLDGIFVSFSNATAHWTEAQWRTDIRSMQTVSMSFFVIAHTAVSIGNATTACPSGVYEAYFPPPPSHAACFKQIGDLDAPGGTVGNVLRAASAVGLDVHIGLGLVEHGFGLDDWSSLAQIRAFATTQALLARQLFAISNASASVTGFYTVVEESNGWTWMENIDDFAHHYLNPVAADIKSMRSDLLVWSSPYAVANRTRYPATEWLPPAVYSELWEMAFLFAPAFDHVAQQDSMGALANSLGDVREILGNLSAASTRQRRTLWSNVELFEVWPPSCRWPQPCHGRHPAPFARIRAQLANEAALVGPNGRLIAWEWSSCLSPNNGSSQWPGETRANYDEYRRYLQGGA